MRELRNRVGYLLEVGLGYLTVERQVRTLSGGEAQRIHLASALGSVLVGTLYGARRADCRTARGGRAAVAAGRAYSCAISATRWSSSSTIL